MAQPPPPEEAPLREPCPWRIVDDVGGAFSMGAVAGILWNGVKGYRGSPRGYKVPGMITAVKTRAPVMGGSFAVWGGLFSTFDCAFIGIRGKEDPWNSIASGAATGGVLAARMGLSSSLRAAAFGGFFLACIEGLMIAINRMQTDAHKPIMPELPPDPFANSPGGANRKPAQPAQAW